MTVDYENKVMKISNKVIQSLVSLSCMMFYCVSCGNVETRIHRFVVPSELPKIEFGTSMQSNEYDKTLMVGAPRSGRVYSCNYGFSKNSVPSPRKCSYYFTAGSVTSTIGTTMTKFNTEKTSYLVACGNQYSFSCPELDIQERMTGECYSFDMSTREKKQLFTPCPDSCLGLTADLVFVIDASGSVTKSNFEIGLQWVATVLRTFSYDVNKGDLQAGYVIFNEEPYDIQKPRKRSYYDLEGNITTSEYKKGGTRTDLAINEAKNVLVSEIDSRKNIPKVMITVTDGRSNEPVDTEIAASSARDAGIVMIAVGVGNSFSENELRLIATGDIYNSTRVMTVSSYNKLGEILDRLSQLIKETAAPTREGVESNSTTELTNCQFGSSVATNGNGLYVGAIGSYDRMGTIAEFLNMDNFPDAPPTGNIESSEVAEMLGTTTDELKDIYFGYSVTTGYFQNDRTPWIATGAPRYLSKGLVLIYKDSDKSVRTTLMSPSGHAQVGQYFGHTVLAMDLNKDNYDDLLISAPLHSESSGYDEGVVFVYMNDRSTLAISNWKNRGFSPVILRGNQVAGSRFGMSIVNGADIDRNGYDDVIIGAPSEKSMEKEQDSGSIYIYFASANGLDESRVQRIEGKTLSNGLSGFGWAISSGSDFDGNSYPDIAVSAPHSDKIVLLRTRKLIATTFEVLVEPATIDIALCLRFPNEPCVNVIACISAQYLHNAQGESFAMVRNITLDSFIDESVHRRFHFMGLKSNVLSEGPIDIGLSKSCKSYDVQLNVESLGKVNGGGLEVVPQVEVTADLAPSHKQQIMSAILPPFNINKETAGWTFSKGCKGESERCEHDLILTAEFSEPMLSTPILLNEESKKLFVNCTIENTGTDHAYFVRVNISSGNLTVNRMVSSCMSLADDESDPSLGTNVIKYNAGSSILKDLMVTGDKCKFTIEFDFTKLQSLSNEPQVRISGKVYSNAGGEQVQYDPDISNNKFSYHRPLQYDATPVIAGESRPELVYLDLLEDKSISTVRTLEDKALGGPQTNFRHIYSIYNIGPLGLANSKIRISWPEFSINGQRLLYLVGVQCEPAEACNCEKNGKTNSLRIAPNEASIRPYYREVIVDYPNDDESFKAIKEVNCQNSICGNISCDLDYIEKFEQVKISAFFKPWVPSFHKDFSKGGFYNFFELIPSNMTPPPVKDGLEVVSTITSFDPNNPSGTLPSGGLNIGAIIGGIAGGLLLLAIVILVMWKFGFFQSKYGKMTRDARQTIRQQRPDGVEEAYEETGQTSQHEETFKSSEQLCD